MDHAAMKDQEAHTEPDQAPIAANVVSLYVREPVPVLSDVTERKPFPSEASGMAVLFHVCFRPDEMSPA